MKPQPHTPSKQRMPDMTSVAEAEMERALREILFARKPGPTPKMIEGALIERIERIAHAAIERFGGGGTGLPSDALNLAEGLFPGKFWVFGKGRVQADEPLYGFRVFEPGEEDPIAEAESNDPVECIRLALRSADRSAL